MISLNMLFQGGVDALVLGIMYFVVASGLTLVFGITRIVNFAYGELYMLGGFATYYMFHNLHLPFPLIVVLSMLAIGLLSAGMDRVFFSHMRGKTIPCLVLGIGLSLIISTLVMVGIGGEDRAIPSPYSGSVNFLGATLTNQRLVLVVLGIAMIVSLYWLVARTKQGKAMRAVTTDRAVSLLQGINVERIYTLSMFVGGALAGGAGAIMAPLFYINPFIGGGAMWKAIIVITLGGMGSIPGAALASLILAGLETFGRLFVGGYADILVFLLLIIILLFRPNGMFGLPFEVH